VLGCIPSASGRFGVCFHSRQVKTGQGFAPPNRQWKENPLWIKSVDALVFI